MMDLPTPPSPENSPAWRNGTRLRIDHLRCGTGSRSQVDISSHLSGGLLERIGTVHPTPHAARRSVACTDGDDSVGLSCSLLFQSLASPSSPARRSLFITTRPWWWSRAVQATGLRHLNPMRRRSGQWGSAPEMGPPGHVCDDG